MLKLQEAMGYLNTLEEQGYILLDASETVLFTSLTKALDALNVSYTTEENERKDYEGNPSYTKEIWLEP